eukprot:6209243-Pleurochrysis_carterae.AAC.5
MPAEQQNRGMTVREEKQKSKEQGTGVLGPEGTIAQSDEAACVQAGAGEQRIMCRDPMLNLCNQEMTAQSKTAHIAVH